MNTTNKPTIYIFGNILLSDDNTPLKLIPMLQKRFPAIDFIEADPNENIHPQNGKLIIIDTIIAIDKVTVINDIEKIDLIAQNPNYSLHDLDLGFMLKLLKKIGELTDVLIFGVPQNIKKHVAYTQLISCIEENMDDIRSN